MNQLIRNNGFKHLVGILLLALFMSKMCAPVSNLISNKFLSCLKVCTETDKTEKEEKKSTEKEIQNIHHFNKIDAQHALLWFNCFGKSYNLHHKIAYRLDKFGSVPTPPPDNFC